MGIATKAHKGRVIEIIVNAFKDNQSVNYIVKQDEKRLQRITTLVEYSFFQGSEFGEVFISEDQNATCILVYPHLKKTTWQTILWDLKLICKVIGLKKVKAALQRESQLKSNYPNTPYAHLWYIGVDPFYQQKGIGSKLLQEVIDHCGSLPIYLETSVLSNLAWYEKHGFKRIKTLDLGYLLHLYKKD